MVLNEDLLLEINSAWSKFDDLYLKKYPGDALYHYTGNSSAVRGMLENRKIWLSPYNDVNDPSEISHGMELALDEAKAIRSSTTKPSDIKSYDLLIQVIGRYQAYSTQEFYFICFSEAGDEDISQWREYGDRGNGFCIEFLSKNIFYDPNRKQNLVGPGNPLLEVRPIVYDDAQKRRLLNSFFTSLNSFILNSGPGGCVLVVMFLRQVCTYFKHKAYGPEKEWRTVVLSSQGRLFLSYGTLQVFELSGQFRKKVVLDLPSQMEPLDSIYKVTCGPKQNSSKCSATKHFIDSLQVGMTHQVQVTHSRVPMV